MSLQVGVWRVRPELKRIERGAEVRALEPKVMDLLVLLASEPGGVFSREHLRSVLWEGVTVGDDAIARSIFKLRRALDDDSTAPRYVETVSKRGYRLIAPVGRNNAGLANGSRRYGPLAAVAAAFVFLAAPAPAPGPERGAQILIERARDNYALYSFGGNERAAALYERVLTEDPENREALAGLAMVEVQRAVRWSSEASSTPATLGAALADGRLTSADAVAALDRAALLLSRTQAHHDTTVVLQAHGLLRSARGDLAGAANFYRQALDRDPGAFGAMINLADVLGLQHDDAGALEVLESAYVRLSASYDMEARRLGPWLSPLGVEIARRRLAKGDRVEALAWVRRVLDDTGDAAALDVREASTSAVH